MILTAEQQEIKNHSKGVALIQAGPGCGKTQTLSRNTVQPHD